MTRKTKAELAAEAEAQHKTDLLGAARQDVQSLSHLILHMRSEYGMQWSDIGKAIGVPGYCCMVLAGQIKANRPTPSGKR